MKKEIDLKVKSSVKIMSMLLKMVREERGYTLEQAAQITGFSKEKIADYETDVLGSVPIDVLCTYCEKLNCDFSKLISCVSAITTPY